MRVEPKNIRVVRSVKKKGKEFFFKASERAVGFCSKLFINNTNVFIFEMENQCIKHSCLEIQVVMAPKTLLCVQAQIERKPMSHFEI